VAAAAADQAGKDTGMRVAAHQSGVSGHPPTSAGCDRFDIADPVA